MEYKDWAPDSWLAAVTMGLESMLEYKRTNGKDKDFIENCRRLDKDLDQRVGKEIQRSKYEKHNQLDQINEAIVVYEHDNVVGAGSIRQYDEKTVELKRIYVAPAFRGRGIGTKLVSLLVEWGRELGYRRMLLETGKTLTESIALYSKLGFERIPNYGPYEHMTESICMAKNIDFLQL